MGPTEERKRRAEALRGCVIASANGAPDGKLWAQRARQLGITHMRITDLFGDSTAQALNNGGDKLGELDSKVRWARDANIRFWLDLSYVRNLFVKEKVNPYYKTWQEWLPYFREVLRRDFPDSSLAYQDYPTLDCVALAGEPMVLWGDDNPVQQAGSADQYVWSLLQQVEAVRRLGYDGPIAAGGFIHLGADGRGRDAHGDLFDQVARMPETDVFTAHGYENPTADALRNLARIATQAGKPFILEEVGFSDTADDAKAAKLAEFAKVASLSGLAGVGLWNIGQYGDFDVRPDTGPKSAAAWLQVVDAVNGRRPVGASSVPAPTVEWVQFAGDMTPSDTFIATLVGHGLCVGPKSEWGSVTVGTTGQKRVATIPPGVLGDFKPQRTCYPLLRTDGTSDGATVEVWPNRTVVANVPAGGAGKRVMPMMFAPMA
uniref:Endoglucanase, glycoside hydrolase family 5, TIM barrel, HYDROLASE.1A n=1 Tax=Siphoviridae sp. ctgaU3 TaxID=2825609 RepID=A0A8S5UW57_9CAUD|nr:MAG TPA: Endoglucanase, glycoside hydrolase family 5, TIM barrel, HYDROLASE.1A [Siphoviridae sp. ctgaU3]